MKKKSIEKQIADILKKYGAYILYGSGGMGATVACKEIIKLFDEGEKKLKSELSAIEDRKEKRKKEK